MVAINGYVKADSRKDVELIINDEFSPILGRRNFSYNLSLFDDLDIEEEE